MKKRRTLIIALLLVAALALGIGYAAYTVNLEVSGIVSAGAPAPLVTFKTVTVGEKTETVTSGNNFGIGATGGQSIDLNVGGFRNKDDKVVVTYTVENGHDFDVTVNEPIVSYTNTDGKKYDANISITPGSWDGLTDGKILAGKTATFTVTVQLIKTFATDASITQNFRIDFTATGVVPTT